MEYNMDWPGHIDKVTFDTWRQDCKYPPGNESRCLTSSMWLWIFDTLTYEQLGIKLAEWGFQ